MMINLKLDSITKGVVAEAMLHYMSNKSYNNRNLSRMWWAAPRVFFLGEPHPVIVISISISSGCFTSRVRFNKRAGKRWLYHPRSLVATLSSRAESTRRVMAARRYPRHLMAPLAIIPNHQGLLLLLSCSCRHSIASNSLGSTAWNRDRRQRGEHYLHNQQPTLSPPRFLNCLSK